MSRDKLAQYQARIDGLESALIQQAPAAALLIADCEAFASTSTALPVEKVGNKEFKASVSTGGTRHAISNTIQGFSHNKRGLATTGASTAASIGTGIGVGYAIGGAAVVGGIAVTAASIAITGGIALGALVLGIGIAAGISAYRSSERRSAHDRFTGKSSGEDYSSSAMMTDLEYVLKNGELEQLARFMDKAIEAGKALDRIVAAPVANCGDAAMLAYTMSRYKWRLRDKLDKGTQMDHISAFVALVDNKMHAADQMCNILGEIHMANLILHLAYSPSEGPDARHQKKAYGKTSDNSPIADYSALRWETWYDGLTGEGAGSNAPYMVELRLKVRSMLSRMSASDRNALKHAVAFILKEGKRASDGDHNDVCGKFQRALAEGETSLDPTTAAAVKGGEAASGASTGHIAGVGLRDYTITQLQGVVMTAGKTAAGSASVASAFGAGAIGSVANIAGSAGAGVVAGVIVSALVGYALEQLNDRANIKAIYGGTLVDPAQRIWVLRSMLQAGRLETLSDSFRKAQQSIEKLQQLYPSGAGQSGDRMRKSSGRETTHEDMVEGTKHLFRLQKHLLRMFAVSSVLTTFYNELYAQVDTMIMSYSEPMGAVDQVLAKVTSQVTSRMHNCTGTCYMETARGMNGVKVAHRLPKVPKPKVAV